MEKHNIKRWFKGARASRKKKERNISFRGAFWFLIDKIAKWRAGSIWAGLLTGTLVLNIILYSLFSFHPSILFLDKHFVHYNVLMASILGILLGSRTANKIWGGFVEDESGNIETETGVDVPVEERGE